MPEDFVLEITSQAFMGPNDFSAHGGIRAVIDGVLITSDDTSYGITQSALQLLRTLEEDRLQAHGRPSSDRDRLPLDNGFLLCHDCGYPLSFGCTNFGTDWRVKHDRGQVILYDPVLMATNMLQPRGLQVGIPLSEYRDKIVAFAREAHDFYFADGADRASDIPEWDRSFWAEFDERLARAEGLAD